MYIKYEKLYRDLNVTPTKQRVELAHIIFSKKQHFTANELISMADRKKLNISMATIYNTLSLLEDKGMLKTINIDNELKFYDTNLDHHHHLYNTTMSTLTVLFKTFSNRTFDVDYLLIFGMSDPDLYFSAREKFRNFSLSKLKT